MLTLKYFQSIERPRRNFESPLRDHSSPSLVHHSTEPSISSASEEQRDSPHPHLLDPDAPNHDFLQQDFDESPGRSEMLASAMKRRRDNNDGLEGGAKRRRKTRTPIFSDQIDGSSHKVDGLINFDESDSINSDDQFTINDTVAQGPKFPTSDAQYALKSMDSMLSTTAIQLVLEACSLASFRVVDGAHISFDDSTQSTIISLRPTEHTVIAPLYHSRHWTLAIFDLVEKSISQYNSVDGLFPDNGKAVLLAFAMRLGLEHDRWNFTELQSPQQQPNSEDCGIHTLAAAMHRMAGVPLGMTVPCPYWRYFLNLLLDPRVPPHQPRKLIQSHHQGKSAPIVPARPHRPCGTDTQPPPKTSTDVRNLLAQQRQDQHERTIAIDHLESIWAVFDSIHTQQVSEYKALLDQIDKASAELRAFQQISHITASNDIVQERQALDRVVDNAILLLRNSIIRDQSRSNLLSQRSHRLHQVTQRVVVEMADLQGLAEEASKVAQEALVQIASQMLT